MVDLLKCRMDLKAVAIAVVSFVSFSVTAVLYMEQRFNKIEQRQQMVERSINELDKKMDKVVSYIHAKDATLPPTALAT